MRASVVAPVSRGSDVCVIRYRTPVAPRPQQFPQDGCYFPSTPPRRRSVLRFYGQGSVVRARLGSRFRRLFSSQTHHAAVAQHGVYLAVPSGDAIGYRGDVQRDMRQFAPRSGRNGAQEGAAVRRGAVVRSGYEYRVVGGHHRFDLVGADSDSVQARWSASSQSTVSPWRTAANSSSDHCTLSGSITPTRIWRQMPPAPMVFCVRTAIWLTAPGLSTPYGLFQVSTRQVCISML